MLSHKYSFSFIFFATLYLSFPSDMLQQICHPQNFKRAEDFLAKFNMWQYIYAKLLWEKKKKGNILFSS